MRKKISVIVMLLILTLCFSLYAGGQQEDQSSETVTLRMGSWRTDDVTQINAFLDAFHQEHPGITIEFQPTNPPDYNATLRLQLESETGPDLMYARSYATGRQLYKDGYLADLSDLKGIENSFSEGSRAPWTTAEGSRFAVPFVAVSHGIYYNKEIFSE